MRVVAQKLHGEPFLLLAAKPALQGGADQRFGQVIAQPFRQFVNYFRLGDAGFFFQLAKGGLLGCLPVIYAALG